MFSGGNQPLEDTAKALKVSVMSLGGEVLVTVRASCRTSIWALKCLIGKSVPGKHMTAAGMMLMLGPRGLANAVSLHDAGVVDGATLSIIFAESYKLLVCTAAGDLELWNQEGRHEGTLLEPLDDVRGAEFSPDSTFLLTMHANTATLCRVDTQECFFFCFPFLA